MSCPACMIEISKHDGEIADLQVIMDNLVNNRTSHVIDEDMMFIVHRWDWLTMRRNGLESKMC